MFALPAIRDALTLRRRAEEATMSAPALLIKAERAAEHIMSGEHAQRKTDMGEKFWQFREYHESDRPQDIDWRQSAKGDGVFIRQRERQNAQSAYIWCDRNAGMDYRSPPALYSKADAASIIAMALSILLTRAGDQVALAGKTKAGRTQKTLERIATHLCEDNTAHHAQAGENQSNASIPHEPLPARALAFIIGDFWQPLEQTKTALDHFLSHHNRGAFIHVIDPAETALPFSGRGIFEPVRGERIQEEVEHIDSIRPAYQQRIADHCEGLQGLCKKHGLIYLAHHTNMPVEQTLRTLWQSIEGER